MKIEHRCPHCETITRPRVVSEKPKHRADYLAFLKHLPDEYNLPPHDGDFRRMKKKPRVTQVKREWYIPMVRGVKNRPLFPAPGKQPCDICKLAFYNRKCAMESRCTAYAYWTAQLTEALDSKEHPLLALMRKGKKCGARNASSSSRTSGKGRSVRRAGKRSR
jgi:hypothetical protein